MLTRSKLSDNELGQDFADFAHGRLADPYSLFRILREEDPVHWSDQLDAWIITGYDDVLDGLANKKFASDRISAYMAALPPESRSSLTNLEQHVRNWLGFTDPPLHTRLRRIAAEFFSARKASDIEEYVGEVVAEVVGRLKTANSFDAVHDLAFAVPARVIYTILGLDSDRQGEFKELTDAIIWFPGNVGPLLAEGAGQAQAAAMRLEQFFLEIAEERRAEPRPDVITALVGFMDDGTISSQEFTSLATFLFVAGHETTVSLIANGILLLLSHTDKRDQLASKIRRDPQMLGIAVEEILRFEAPVQITPRLTRETEEIRGTSIPIGESVIFVNASANRDEAKFVNPDVFDTARQPNRHLSFGWSSHFCLGAPLARLEARAAIGAFLDQLPDFTLVDAGVDWMPNMSIRRPTTLNLRRI